MFRRLSFLFLPLSALWLATACTSSADEPQAGSNEMVFTTEGLSRTSVTGNSNLYNYPFAVYGDMIHAVRQPDSKLILTHNNTEVRYDAQSGVWTYDETQFWFPGFQYSFVAIHPANPLHLSNSQYQNNQLKFTYTQPDNFRKAQDILFATHRRTYTSGKTDPVGFTFSHLLSCMNIQVLFNTPIYGVDSLKVKRITLKNISKKGTWAVTPAPLIGSYMTSDYDFESGSYSGWKILDNADLELDFTDNPARGVTIPNDNKHYQLFSNADALLLLPNPEPGTELIFEYTIFENYGTTSRDVTHSVIIPSAWQAGNNYQLSLDVINHTVNIKCTVEKWHDFPAFEIDVPRK